MSTKTDMAEMGERLKAWRERNPLKSFLTDNGLTQADAATRMGVSRYTMLMWTQGTSSPSAKNMKAIAAFMGWPAANVLAAWEKWESQRP